MFHVVQTQTVNKDCLCLNDNPVPGTFSVSVFGAGWGGGTIPPANNSILYWHNITIEVFPSLAIEYRNVQYHYNSVD